MTAVTKKEARSRSQVSSRYIDMGVVHRANNAQRADREIDDHGAISLDFTRNPAQALAEMDQLEYEDE